MFTEFMEQRAPGHTVCGDTIYKKGFLDLKKDIEARLAEINSKEDQSKKSYKSSKILLESVKNTTGVMYLYTAKKTKDGS
ncbi:pyruvate formate lyase family protein, partial [Clostridioides difficile]|uniref:pyruvate formate lyase family protein n=1 Tax=Clostridioides difficile TaxID=1496 RepID=UPI003F8D8EF3